MSNEFITARSNVEDLLEKKEKILQDAADIIIRASLPMSDLEYSAIGKNISKLLNGFTDDEKIKILQIVLSKIIINM